MRLVLAALLFAAVASAAPVRREHTRSNGGRIQICGPIIERKQVQQSAPLPRTAPTFPSLVKPPESFRR